MRLLVRARLAEDWEPSGNYVYRFSRREIFKFCASFGIPEFGIATFCNQYSAFLNDRVYPLLNNPAGFLIFRGIYSLMNALINQHGNALLVVLKKSPLADHCHGVTELPRGI
jgi:hypothetical protein